ncbi:MAG: hypothetical protein JEZ02_18715 [Desulfatibacillum sp.]|nr:hypothetical protein [Desulfatibacillum sp.]
MTITTHEGWVSFIDIYGFKHILGSENHFEVHERLIAVHDRIAEYAAESSSNMRIFPFSDSVFMAFPTNERQEKLRVLRRCLVTSRALMGFFVEKGFPPRGGVAYGNFSLSSKIVIGPAAVQAYTYEGMAPAPLLILPHKEIIGIENSDIEEGSRKVIFTKSGRPMFAELFFPYPVDNFVEIVSRNYREYMLSGSDQAAIAWYKAKTLIDNIEIRR